MKKKQPPQYEVGKTYITASGSRVKVAHYSIRDGRYKVIWEGMEYRPGRQDPEVAEMLAAGHLHVLLAGSKILA